MIGLLLRAIGVITVVLLGAASGALHVGAALPISDELAYVSRIRGDFEIFLHDVERRLDVNLTNTVHWRDKGRLSQDQAPAWSPDGTQIAFHSNREGSDDIYVMDANGRNLRRLTTHAAMDLHPQWSPDGCCIVYQSFRETDYEIFILRLDTEDPTPRQLTDNGGGDRHPYFSPDGTRIVYASDIQNILGNFELFTMNPDGSDRRGMFTLGEEANSLHPRWSPDGEYILFDSFSDSERNAVYKVRANGRGRSQRIAGEPGRVHGTDAFLPSWSPDGEQVLYVSSALDDNIEVYIAPLVAPFELGAARRVTFNSGIDIQPTLRPRR